MVNPDIDRIGPFRLVNDGGYPHTLIEVRDTLVLVERGHRIVIDTVDLTEDLMALIVQRDHREASSLAKHLEDRGCLGGTEVLTLLQLVVRTLATFQCAVAKDERGH